MSGLDLAIDLDGVCYDFVGALRRFLAVRRGVPMAAMPPATRWAFYTDWGITQAEFVDACDEATDTGQMFWRGDPLPDTEWALHALADAGHRLHYVTARHFGSPGVVKQATKAWVEQHRLPCASVSITSDKTSVAFDVLLDDSPENYAAALTDGRRAYLFTRPWNEHVPGHHVGTWQEFVDVVRGLT